MTANNVQPRDSANGTSGPLRAKSVATGERSNSRKLFTHRKKYKQPSFMKSYRTRQEEWLADTWRQIFAVLLQKEKPDPVTLEAAASRLRLDIDSVFINLKADEIKDHFFSSLPDGKEERKPSFEEAEAKWMSRWIDGFTKQKPSLAEWANLVDFGGEYLVSNEPFYLIDLQVFRLFETFLPDFSAEPNWTSSLRKYAFPGLPEFSNKDSCSDFTYYDKMGKMAELLGISDDKSGMRKTFHLEVKTSKAAVNSFAFSSRQFNIV